MLSSRVSITYDPRFTIQTRPIGPLKPITPNLSARESIVPHFDTLSYRAVDTAHAGILPAFSQAQMLHGEVHTSGVNPPSILQGMPQVQFKAI